ncbi:MAG: hypothetical protein D6746_09615 [Bacteroidetes bacterium]|nr:MAG: hypothetical protein D6746_09615 [Bacteroidota bacterium]
MESKVHTYDGEKITITYDVRRCLHVGECVRGLRAVFDPDRKPWVDPDAADPDAIAEVVARCPTGALHVRRKDGGAAEPVPSDNVVRLAPDGPLYVRGEVEIVTPDGTLLLKDTRVALCRCGRSANKPLCDNSHEGHFSDSGRLGTGGVKEGEARGALKITPARNGPLLLEGPFLIVDAEGREHRTGARAALCRCGASKNKPFCDGSHREIGFTDE